MDRLSLIFEIAPRPADAYLIKNDFLAVIRTSSSAEGRHKLADWMLSVEVMELPEFQDCTKAYHNWFNEILNAMDVPWTNGLAFTQMSALFTFFLLQFLTYHHGTILLSYGFPVISDFSLSTSDSVALLSKTI